MDRDGFKAIEQRALELAVALYKVTDLFPKEEVLKNLLREQALDIIRLTVDDSDSKEASVQLKVLLSYLKVGRAMRLAKPINFEILEREYGDLDTFLQRQVSAGKSEPEKEILGPAFSDDKEKRQLVGEKGNWGVTERQKTILEYARQKRQVKISDLSSVFKELSSKTIQRDLQDLVRKNILTTEGKRRWTIYRTLSNVL